MTHLLGVKIYGLMPGRTRSTKLAKPRLDLWTVWAGNLSVNMHMPWSITNKATQEIKLKEKKASSQCIADSRRWKARRKISLCHSCVVEITQHHSTDKMQTVTAKEGGKSLRGKCWSSNRDTQKWCQAAWLKWQGAFNAFFYFLARNNTLTLR